MSIPQYLTVPQFSKKYPAFPSGGVRSLIFNGEKNGLLDSGAIVRIGRKVIIDEQKWFDWVASQNKKPESIEKKIARLRDSARV